MTWSGSARSSTSASATPACAAPRLPMDAVRSGATTPVATPRPRRRRFDGAGVQSGHHRMVDVVLGDPGVLQRRREGLPGQGDIDLLAEALLPDVRLLLAGDAPTVEELVAAGPAPDQLGHGTLGPAEEGSRSVSAVALLGRAGQPRAQVRDDGQRPTPAGSARPAPRAGRPPRSGTSPPGRRPHTPARVRGRRARSWRWSCRGTRGRGSTRARPGRPRPTSSRAPDAAASTPSVVVSSS